MSQRKDRPLDERVNRNRVRDSLAKEEARVKAEAERLRAQNAGQPGYDSEGNLQTTDQLPDDTEEATPNTNLGDFQEQGGYVQDASDQVLQSSGMPPDLNTPWLPGGQSTEGIPNVDNPKLKEVLKKRKGIKQQNPNLDLPDFVQVNNDASVDVKTRIANEPIPDAIDRDLQNISDEAGGLQNLDDETRIRVLTEIGKRILMRGNPQQQMKYAVQVLKYGSKFARLILSAALAGTGISGYR